MKLIELCKIGRNWENLSFRVFELCQIPLKNEFQLSEVWLLVKFEFQGL